MQARQSQQTTTRLLQCAIDLTCKQPEIEKLEASPISLMPESLTIGMSDADLKDFFAYLMKLP